MNQNNIDISVEELSITITPNAIEQISLIQENDYTIQDQVFRLQIDGKGCGGFDYALGFTQTHPDDLIYKVSSNDKSLTISIDPFTAFYCKSGVIDYIFDIEKKVEGFHFENLNEKDHRGKFFKNESKVPKLKTPSS